MVELVDALEPAVATAWLIIESVSEDLALKKPVFGELDRLAGSDAILATNSSSYPSSRLADAVGSPERLLDVRFQMPPEAVTVELMSCGRTGAMVIDALAGRLPCYGLVPFTIRAGSVGLVNRIWHATRRECQMVVAEGVSAPKEVDRIWRLSAGTALGPFRIMDRMLLDVALAIEKHYATFRDGIPAAPRELLHDYVDKGFLGVKSGRGLYDDYGG
jgi:3-hydroxybutyryl-CoA dehydrogenase